MNAEMEKDCMELISKTGTARSAFIESIFHALTGEVEKAYAFLQEGKELLCEAHETHFHLLARDAGGELEEMPLLLVHAEDQMSGTEIFETLAFQAIRIQKEQLNKIDDKN